MSKAQNPQASSIAAGFFQRHPEIPPGYTQRTGPNQSKSGDTLLENILSLYLPDPIPVELDRSLHDFARKCIDPKTLRLTVDAETHQPTLHLLNTFGEANNQNPLRTSEGWKALKDIQTRAGIVAHGYKDVSGGTKSYNRRVFQFALLQLWSSSSANVTCPAAMSDGAAILISKYLGRSPVAVVAGQDADILRLVLQEVYARLTSFDPTYAWTSGQWMTERPGGSDVSRTETLARLASEEDLDLDRRAHCMQNTDAVDMPLGPYIVDGFKWFSSATDADMVVLLAQTPEGLSAFYAPMRRASLSSSGRRISVMNGVRISRLKQKLGTQALPTAELEIKGMRAWMVGEAGKGVREISSILNATRLWTAHGSISGWSRGLAVSKAYANVRKIKNDQALADNRQHVKWIAGEIVKYRACAHFAYLGIALLGLSENGFESSASNARARQWLPKTKDETSLLLRILTPVMKTQCSLWSIWGLRECMESLGGIGYCENQEDGGMLNLARMFRDANVNSIWEGTTNILAEDFVRSIKSSEGALSALDRLVRSILDSTVESFPRDSSMVGQGWDTLRNNISSNSHDSLLYHGRDLLQRIQDVLCGSLLMLDAVHTRGLTERIVAERWIFTRFAVQTQSYNHVRDVDEASRLDRLIFDGDNASSTMDVPSKL